MKKWVLATVVLTSALSALAQNRAQLDETMIKAMAGDYQAQRNLAYGYVAMPYPGQVKDPVNGCAWYLVIKNSGHPRYHAGDEGNVKVYCNRLTDPDFEAARSLALQYLQAIYKTQAQR